MFEVPPPTESAEVDAPALAAARVTGFKETLTAALDGVSELDDRARVDAIHALEELVCVSTAAQAQLARELDASQRAVQSRAGVRRASRGKGVAHQVALARRESPRRGQGHLGLAKVVAAELPHTWDAWRRGLITEWKATLIARETACLSVEHRLEVDRVIAADAAALEAMGDGEVAGRCAAEAARLDAASVTARRRKAESERGVTLRPAPDTMAYLSALVPVQEGVAAYAALRDVAASARAAGDDRTTGQLMADSLVAAVVGLTGHAPATAPGTVPDRPAGAGTRADARADVQADVQADAQAGAGDAPSRTPRLELGLVMSDAALFGESEDPAHLEGFGPIPAELAREIIAGACTREETIWLRRLYTSPTTGELVSMDGRGRFFRGSLSRFIRLRDRTCRNPWCNAPIRHVDHVRRWADGGPTSASNGQGYCEACNYAMDAPGWRSRPGPDGSVETTTPTGHTYRTRPPAVATIRRRDVPRLTVDYVLAT